MQHDAFICYSHSADGQLAPALQRGLEQLAEPWSRLRALQIFCDETNLWSVHSVWQSIVDFARPALRTIGVTAASNAALGNCGLYYKFKASLPISSASAGRAPKRNSAIRDAVTACHVAANGTC